MKEGTSISDGYNGTPTGFPNECEDAEGLTHWYVLHAEANAIMKVARSTNNARGATLYLTHSPCKECSKLIMQAGIKRLVYLDAYKDPSGLELLQNGGLNSSNFQFTGGNGSDLLLNLGHVADQFTFNAGEGDDVFENRGRSGGTLRMIAYIAVFALIFCTLFSILR